MPSDIEVAANEIADALAPSPKAPAARWRWGTVKSVANDGTMSVIVGGSTMVGVRCAQHVMGAQVGDRVRVLYCGTECMVDAIRAAGKAPHIDAEEWLSALDLDVEMIYETSDITVKRMGRLVMVQCHGIYATPGSGNAWANIDLSDYKPSYNVSALVTEPSATGHIARLWVAAANGFVYLNQVNSTAAAQWYGTLTYIY